MNKNKFRVVFNRVRGLMMVIAEISSSRQTGGKTAPSFSVPEIVLVSLRPIAFSMLILSGQVMVINPALADIIADPGAPTNQRPVIVQTANGLPLVNIQTPSAAGVSRNTYKQFDVKAQGAILNNSNTNVQTQLGGWIQGNPYLAGGTAKVILNEVNSNNPSLLNGYVEVAGSRAQVVIANPAGISCDGCGFINASRTTLTTGTPIMNSGNLLGYRVGGGSISFLGSGLDTSQADFTDVIARAVEVNAGIWANTLNITTGTNQVSIDSNGNQNTITPIAPNSGSAVPAFAVDVAALGGMYAGKIHMIGTESGLGVRNIGTIGASVGEISLTAEGLLQNSGTITAKTNINIDTVALEGAGSITAESNIDIGLDSDYIHTGELEAGGNLDLQTTGNVTNQSTMIASQSLTISAANIDNAVTGEITGLNTGLTATDTITNRGTIDGVDTLINADTLTNTGTGSIFGDHLAIQVANLGNDASAVIAARNRLDIGASSIENRSGGLIFSTGDLAIGGSLDSNNQAIGSADTLINDGSTIESLGNATLAVTDIQNLNADLVTQVVLTETGSFDRFTARGRSDILESDDHPAFRIGDVGVEWRYGSTYGLSYNFREYTRYLGTRRLYETQVVSSTQGQILAGADMTISGSVMNSDSQIIAGGNLDISGATVQNLNSAGQTTTTYNGTAYYYDWDGNDNDYDVDIIGPYNPANTVVTYNLSTSRLEGSSAPTGSGTTVTSAAVPVSTSTLFQPNPDVAANYLIETNPRFANYRTWLSSDYMLSQLSFDPAITQKRLGDGFYEQRLVREQVAQLTGRRFLEGHASDEAQYQSLMTSALTQMSSLQLIPGIALTAAQIAQLTSDMVWMVEETVTLPDGTVTQALVPQVYVRLQAGDLNPSTGIMAGNTVTMNLSGDVTNQGTIAGRNFLALNAENINNLGGQMGAETTLLSASNNINNIGGQINAQEAMVLDAGNDINLRSTTQSSKQSEGASSFSRTNIDRVAGLYMSNPDAILVANAGNDVNLMAASIINRGENSVTQISAAADINLGTVTIAEQNSSIRNAKNYVKHGGTKEVGSVIETTGDIAFNAGNNFNAKAANITSESGAINVTATKDINIIEGRETANFDTARKVKRSSTFSSKTKTQRDVFKSDNSISSNFSADTVSLQAGNDLNIRGSNVVSDDGTTLDAGENVNITAAKNTAYELHERKTKKSGLSSSGMSVSIGTQQLNTKQTTTSTSRTGSTVGSVDGDVDIISGKNVRVTGSDLIAGQDINVTGQNVTLDAAIDTQDTQQTTKFKQSGLTLALSAPVITAVQAAVATAERSQEVKDDKLKALYELKTALNVVKAADAVAEIANSSDPVAASGIKLSLSLGTSKSSSTSTSHDSVARGDSLTAARDINVTATGKATDSGGQQPGTGNITMVGVAGSAGRDINLAAANDINLLSATNASQQHSKNKSSSASVGVAIGADQNGAGISVFANASAAKGKANGNAVSHTETTLKAGDTLSLESGHDTTLKGAIVSANTVIADIGGNLHLESEQDSANDKSKQSSVSGGISYTFGAGGFGGSISTGKQKIDSTYNSVIEQTAIQAGDGGFDINVAGNTHLKGAVIDSNLTAQVAGNNQLTTATLTTENIENKGEYTASSSTFGVNFNGNTNTGTDKPAGGTAGSSMKAGLGGIGMSDSDEASGTTKAAVANADITITEDAAQQALTGQDAEQTVALLNRDTQHANGSIENPFNLEKVQEQLEFLQVAGETILLPVAAHAAKWIGDQFPPDPEHPERINPAKLLAHAALGAAVSQLLGTGWEAGAAAGAMGDILPSILAKAFEKDENGKIKNPEAFKAAAVLISAALASATGTDLAQTINAAMITQNAVENNWLKHQEKIDLAKSRQDCAAGGQEACRNAAKLEVLDKLRNKELLNACVNLSPEACATQLNLDSAAKAYLVENFYTIGFGRVIAQFGEHAEQAAPPPQLTDITLDLLPIVGDIKGFTEAESPFDYTIALIGALGPAGDAAKALVKEAKVLLDAGETAKAIEKLDAAQIVVANAARGKVFEDGVLAALNLPKNTVRIPVTLPGGKAITVIPDALKDATIIEAKDVKYLTNSSQFRGYLATDKEIRLVVSPDTKISAPLQKLILEDSKGSIEVFDPVTKALSAWKPK